MNPLTGIVLAGGKSRRLGTDKAQVTVGGRSIINRVMDALEGFCDEVLIAANDPAPYEILGLRIVPDEEPGGGSVMGVYSALKVAANRFAFVVACDMPFLSRPFIEFMAGMDRDYDVLAPYVSGHIEPLHAIYSQACIPAMEKLIAGGDKKIINFYDDIKLVLIQEERVNRFSPDGLVFMNVNTPEDLEKARTIEAGDRVK